MANAKLTLNGKDYSLPVIVGTEDEVAVDCTKLRSESGAITYDPGYGNTGSCKSAITFIDGEKGILRHRGYPIEDLAANATFTEVAYLLIYGELPNDKQIGAWRTDLSDHSVLHERMVKLIDHFPLTAHPMGMLASLVASMASFYPQNGEDDIDVHITRLIAQVKTIAAFYYKWSIGQPFVYPRRESSYSTNFLRMMFGSNTEEWEVPKVLENALRMLLIVHADHEQNCSTSTVRMVGSSNANIYASMAAGICALWGPRHGGANQAVLEMLEEIRGAGGDYKGLMQKVKDKESGARLMGFGHRVYKNFDPRAQILKKSCDQVLKALGKTDPLLDIAKNLEAIALKDDYFVERNLYPNVDFYSGILYRAMGIPMEMFTVMFAIGRMPGWIAHWKEMRDEGSRIHRPRQIYTGETKRPYKKKAAAKNSASKKPAAKKSAKK